MGAKVECRWSVCVWNECCMVGPFCIRLRYEEVWCLRMAEHQRNSLKGVCLEVVTETVSDPTTFGKIRRAIFGVELE